jgi:thiol-disulfide isomerase/thioredoxin
MIVAALLGVAHCWSGLAAAEDETEGLKDGWRRRVTIPAVKFEQVVYSREWRLTLWTKGGWLIVRRTTAHDDLEWQIVLARASDPEKPQVKVNEKIGLVEVRYRGYLIREGMHGRLRVFRERKTADFPDWPRLDLEGERRDQGAGGADMAYMRAIALDQWCWIESGVSDKRPDVWIRLQPTTVRPGKASRGNGIYGLEAMLGGPVEMFYGDSQIQDEGDLLIATRVVVEDAERGLDDFTLRDALPNKNTPALAGDEWFNSVDPLSLEKLEGHVVLLAFWSQDCGSAVKRMPQVEELRKKFSEPGLIVIGVHSAEKSEGLGQFLKDNKISFPVMIDRGETIKQYGVGALPNYFLIDKAGTVVWGFAIAPPTDEQIEALLK